MADFLKASAKKEEPATVLNDLMEKKLKTLQKQREEYDICGYRELLYYEPGDRIDPEVEKRCLKFLKFYKGICEEECFEQLMKSSAGEKNSFLAFQNADVFLMEEKWKEIFADIEEHPERFERYYPMVRVQGDENTRWIIYAYVTNDALFRYLEERMKEPELHATP